MHRIFNVEDILLRLTEAVHDASSSPIVDGARNDLTVLAQISKSISEASLKVLWRECTSFKRLLMCFPEELWLLRGNKFHLRGPPLPNSWARFDRHASLVNVLRLDLMKEQELIDFANVMRDLFLYRLSSGPLLPNLCVLDLIDGRPSVIHFCRLFLGSGSALSKLKVYFVAPFGAEAGVFLASVPALCPAIEAVTLGGISHPLKNRYGPLSDENRRALTSLAVHSTHLRQIKIYEALTDEAWDHLEACQKLLYIGLDVSAYPSRIRTSVFPSLEVMHLLATQPGHIKAACDITSGISSHALYSVTLHVRDTELTRAALTSYCGAVLTVARDTLTALHIEYSNSNLGPEHDIETSESAVHTPCFEPLQATRCLKQLTLHVRGLSLDDTSLLEFADWFPELEGLSVQGSHHDAAYLRGRPPLVTFRGVLAVIGQCKKLRKLALLFAAGDEPPQYDGPLAEDAVNTVFAELDVTYSPILHHISARVALALSAVAPRLRHLEYIGLTNGEESGTAWFAVKNCLEVIRRMRAVESGARL